MVNTVIVCELYLINHVTSDTVMADQGFTAFLPCTNFQHHRRRGDRHLGDDLRRVGKEVQPENDAHRLGARRLGLPLRVRRLLLPQRNRVDVDEVDDVTGLDSVGQLYCLCAVLYGESLFRDQYPLLQKVGRIKPKQCHLILPLSLMLDV